MSTPKKSTGHGGKRPGAGRPTTISRQIALLKDMAGAEVGKMTRKEIEKALEEGMTASYLALARAMPLVMAYLIQVSAYDKTTARFLAALFMKMNPTANQEPEDPWSKALQGGGKLEVNNGVVVHGNATFPPRTDAPGADGSFVDGEYRSVPDSLPPGPN